MKLTVIGYWGGYPSKDEASAAYVLERDGYMIVLDLGSASLAKLQKYKTITDIDAVILSHYHADHIADVGVLQHALLVQRYITGRKKTIPIYGHDENMYEFKKLDSDDTEAINYDPHEVLKLGPFYIRFLRTNHSVPCYGMRITDGSSTIVYTADSAYQDDWIKFARDADLLLADTNFYAHQDGQVAGHMTSKEVGTLARKANVGEIILTHLPHFGIHEDLVLEAAHEFSGKITLAYEELTWEK